MSHLVNHADKKIQSFLRKVFYGLEENNESWSWDTTGTKFYIRCEKTFASVLYRLFGNRRVQAFIQQLLHLGFYKDPNGIIVDGEQLLHVFSHPSFRRNCPDLLSNIHKIGFTAIAPEQQQLDENQHQPQPGNVLQNTTSQMYVHYQPQSQHESIHYNEDGSNIDHNNNSIVTIESMKSTLQQQHLQLQHEQIEFVEKQNITNHVLNSMLQLLDTFQEDMRTMLFLENDLQFKASQQQVHHKNSSLSSPLSSIDLQSNNYRDVMHTLVNQVVPVPSSSLNSSSVPLHSQSSPHSSFDMFDPLGSPSSSSSSLSSSPISSPQHSSHTHTIDDYNHLYNNNINNSGMFLQLSNSNDPFNNNNDFSISSSSSNFNPIIEQSQFQQQSFQPLSQTTETTVLQPSTSTNTTSTPQFQPTDVVCLSSRPPSSSTTLKHNDLQLHPSPTTSCPSPTINPIESPLSSSSSSKRRRRPSQYCEQYQQQQIIDDSSTTFNPQQYLIDPTSSSMNPLEQQHQSFHQSNQMNSINDNRTNINHNNNNNSNNMNHNLNNNNSFSQVDINSFATRIATVQNRVDELLKMHADSMTIQLRTYHLLAQGFERLANSNDNATGRLEDLSAVNPTGTIVSNTTELGVSTSTSNNNPIVSYPTLHPPPFQTVFSTMNDQPQQSTSQQTAIPPTSILARTNKRTKPNDHFLQEVPSSSLLPPQQQEQHRLLSSYLDWNPQQQQQQPQSLTNQQQLSTEPLANDNKTSIFFDNTNSDQTPHRSIFSTSDGPTDGHFTSDLTTTQRIHKDVAEIEGVVQYVPVSPLLPPPPPQSLFSQFNMSNSNNNSTHYNNFTPLLSIPQYNTNPSGIVLTPRPRGLTTSHINVLSTPKTQHFGLVNNNHSTNHYIFPQ